ncbi:DUF1801 domain-containing protein [Candidatus Leptofilum sp.]|uniref:DUF1801 domain-containing protein n=1 Tax=Candidatus Leptofilum sp. TaxID=3241576 RepID=UPI003B5C901B
MNKNPEVDNWFENYDNPMKELVQAVREKILAADERIEETIKWQAPTFVYRGNLASFFPKSKKHASLMFHKGKFIQGDFPNLVGDGKEARSMKFTSFADLETKKDELSAIVVAWCDQQDSK